MKSNSLNVCVCVLSPCNCKAFGDLMFLVVWQRVRRQIELGNRRNWRPWITEHKPIKKVKSKAKHKDRERENGGQKTERRGSLLLTNSLSSSRTHSNSPNTFSN